jgi:hypothetical protein
MVEMGGVPEMTQWNIDFRGPAEGYLRVIYVEHREKANRGTRFRVYDVPIAKMREFLDGDRSDWLDRHAIFRYADTGYFDLPGHVASTEIVQPEEAAIKRE